MTTYLDRLRARELENIGIRMPDAIEESETDDSSESDEDDEPLGIEIWEDTDE